MQLSPEEYRRTYDIANEIAEKAKMENQYGNKDKALTLFNEALKNQKIPWILADRGKLKIDMNDAEGAIADLTRAINAEKRAFYYICRAEAYRMLGKDELADEDIKEAEKLPKDY